MFVDKDKPQPPLDDRKDPAGVVLTAFIENDNKLQEVNGDIVEITDEINYIAGVVNDKLNQFETDVKANLKVHTDKRGAVHGENKQTVGLGNKDNWRMATLQEHQEGTILDAYAHPAGMKEMIESKVKLNPDIYIPARIIPFATGGLMGEIPQYPRDTEIGELVQSKDDPNKYLGDTPWEFSTTSGILVFPTLNNAPAQGRYTAFQGALCYLHSPMGGTKIRVYDKTLDSRRTRPSFIRGWSASIGTLAKAGKSLFDKSDLLYRETSGWMLRSFNKNALPFDYASLSAFYSTEPLGGFEYAEGYLYNLDAAVEHRSAPGTSGTAEIYSRLNVKTFGLRLNDYNVVNRDTLPSEQTATLLGLLATYQATLPAHGKVEFFPGDRMGTFFVRLKNLVTLPAGVETELMKNVNIDMGSEYTHAWRNRMQWKYFVRLSIGWWNKDKTKYWHGFMDFEVKDNPGSGNGTVSSMVVNTFAPEWTMAKQVMNANYDLTGTGFFKDYAPDVKGNPMHPLAMGGVFESQGGHLRNYTLYGRQYTDYYQHDMGSNLEFINKGSAKLPMPTRVEHIVRSTLNVDGMYGDHLRNIPISINQQSKRVTYLTQIRDHRDRYRWAMTDVNGEIEMRQESAYDTYIPGRPENFRWLPTEMTVPRTFMIVNDDYSATMDINGMVFTSENRFRGFSNYTLNPDAVTELIEYGRDVRLHNDIVNWITSTAGGFSNPDILAFHHWGTLFWFCRCTSPTEFPANEKDLYYGVIKNCSVIETGGELILQATGPIPGLATINSTNLNKKANLSIKHGEVFGMDGLSGRDVYLALTENNASVQSIDLMVNMGPFNNFYIEMKMEQNKVTGEHVLRPKPEAVDPIFPYVDGVGYQIDYDAHILYGTKLPYRMHVNYQSPVMLKKGMWSYRKTPNNFGVFTRRHGFFVNTGGMMGGYRGIDVYPIGSVLSIGGKNTVVKEPVQLLTVDAPPYTEMYIRMEGEKPVLYGTDMNPKGYDLEPNNGSAPVGWMVGNLFHYHDPAGWRSAFHPVIDNARQSYYGYGNSFAHMLGKPGSGEPVNRFYLDTVDTDLTWDTTKGRVIDTIGALPHSVTVNGETFSNTGNQSFTIPAKFTGTVSVKINYIQTLKWGPGLVSVNTIGITVNKLDFSESDAFTITAALPRRITNLNRLFYKAKGTTYPGLENWDLSYVTDVSEMFRETTTFNQPLPNWVLPVVTTMASMFHGALGFNQPVHQFNPVAVKDCSYAFRATAKFNQAITWNLLHCTNAKGLFRDTVMFNSQVNGIKFGARVDIAEMFFASQKFNQPIDNWDLTTVVSAQDMFNQAQAFVQNLNLSMPQCINVIQMFRNNAIFNANVNIDLPICYMWERMFEGTVLFNKKLPAWNFPANTSLKEMFQAAGAYNQSMDHWMMERVVNLYGMFRFSVGFQQDITTWKLYKVVDVGYIFASCNYTGQVNDITWPTTNASIVNGTGIFYANPFFNNPLNKWNMISFQLFNGIFNGARRFNQDISMWDTRNAIVMENLFKNADAFAGDISGWNVSKCTNFQLLAYQAINFNSPLANWDVSSGMNFTSMFNGAVKFNQDISKWNMGKAVTLNLMFNGALIYDSPLDDWNVSSAIEMHDMFNGCVKFNQPLGKWNVGNVQLFNGMFKGCSIFNQDLSTWDVKNGIDFASMFRDALVYNKPMNTWNMGKATNLASMFKGAFEFNQPIGSWNTINVTNMAYMFDAEPDFVNTNSTAATKFNQDISGWKTGKVTSIRAMFRGAEWYNRPMNNWDTTNVENMSEVFNRGHAFNQDLDNWKTDKVTTIGWMFYGCTVFNGKVGTWNTGNVLEATGCFQYADAFNQPLTSWRLPLCTSIASMFFGAIKFNQPLNDLDVRANTTLQSVFQAAVTFNQPLDKWDVSKVTSFLAVFSGASAFNQPLTTWDVSKGTVFANMFMNASLFNGAVNNWNTISATNMKGMFNNAKAFNGDISGWNVSKVTDLSTFAWGASEFKSSMSAWNVGACTNFTSMFAYCPKFNSPLNIWNMTKATTIRNMFSNTTIFNQPLANWNLAACTDFTGVFFMASAFNQDLSLWNVNKATTFQDMFYGATAYNKPMNAWVTSACTNFSGMFRDAVAFNQDITSWNVGAGTDFSSMFYGASSFNQFLNTWNVSNGVNFQDMFRNAIVANPTMNTWNVTKGVNFSGMFYGAAKFASYPILWTMTNATNLSNMFRGCTLFNADLSNWNVSKVTDMSSMFQDATAFNGDISGWTTTALTKMDGMFYGANSFNRNISNWNISQVTSLADVFRNAKAFNSPLGNWNVSNITNLSWTFSGASLFNQDLSTWDVSKVTDMRATFNACTKFNGNIENWNTIACTDTRWMFQDAKEFAGSLANWKLGNVVSLARMFSGAAMFNGDISGWNVGKSTSFQGTFSGCIAFNRNLGTWDVSKSTDFSEMFKNALAFNQDISNWVVSNGVNFTSMFDAYAAGEVGIPTYFMTFNQDLSQWNVGKGTLFNAMFRKCKLFASDLANWNMASAQEIGSMFQHCEKFNSNINAWNVANVTNMRYTFYGAIIFDQPIGGWNTGKVTDLTETFREAAKFNQPLAGWNTINVTVMNGTFRDAVLFNQDLSGWNVAKVTTHVSFDTGATAWAKPRPNFPS